MASSDKPGSNALTKEQQLDVLDRDIHRHKRWKTFSEKLGDFLGECAALVLIFGSFFGEHEGVLPTWMPSAQGPAAWSMRGWAYYGGTGISARSLGDPEAL